MNFRVVVFSGLLALSTSGTSIAADVGQASNSPAAPAAIVDAKEYLAHIDRIVGMAIRGEYGPLRRNADARRIREARDRIADLLDGHATTTELDEQERVAMLNAEELIKGVIRNDDKSRIVCTLVAGTGSRLAKKECMTVADREARAKAARAAAKESMRGLCVPGEVSRCTK
jgi:hypothetical protein